MSILKSGNDTLRAENILMQKPISMYSDDPTDFEYKKYIVTRTDYFLNDEPITKEQAEAWVVAHT